jgi:hypothetical protein
MAMIYTEGGTKSAWRFPRIDMSLASVPKPPGPPPTALRPRWYCADPKSRLGKVHRPSLPVQQAALGGEFWGEPFRRALF